MTMSAALESDEHKMRIISSRCSSSYLAGLWGQLGQMKNDAIDLMGFGSLRHLPAWHVNHKLLVALANSYNTNTHALETPTITLRVTADLVGRALGLPYRGVMFREEGTNEEERLVKPFRGAQLKELKDQIMANPLESDADIDAFCRVFIVMSLKCFLCPNTVVKITPWQIYPIFDVNEPTCYNWSRYIHDRLERGIKKWKEGGTDHIDGCVYVLMGDASTCIAASKATKDVTTAGGSRHDQPSTKGNDVKSGLSTMQAGDKSSTYKVDGSDFSSLNLFSQDLIIDDELIDDIDRASIPKGKTTSVDRKIQNISDSFPVSARHTRHGKRPLINVCSKRLQRVLRMHLNCCMFCAKCMSTC